MLVHAKLLSRTFFLCPSSGLLRFALFLFASECRFSRLIAISLVALASVHLVDLPSCSTFPSRNMFSHARDMKDFYLLEMIRIYCLFLPQFSSSTSLSLARSSSLSPLLLFHPWPALPLESVLHPFHFQRAM